MERSGDKQINAEADSKPVNSRLRNFIFFVIAALTFVLVLLVPDTCGQTATTKRAEEKRIGRPGVDKAVTRPFRVNFPEKALSDLRRRIAATRWPDKETVADSSQGAQLAKMQTCPVLGKRIRLA